MNNYDINEHKCVILLSSLKKIGINLSERQVNQFLTYYELLIEKNKVMNLTAITDYEEVVLKHFTDSLAVVHSLNMENYSSLIDVGTGAGFPGIPLKIVFPHLKVVLMDSLNKRVEFLNKVINELELADISAVHSRAEDLGHRSEYREQFDLCVSRAVANLSVLSEYCIPFVKKGGVFVSYKSADIDIEINASKNALFLLGGRLQEKKVFFLPNSDISRSLIIIEKDRKTPAKYPRKAGTPAKNPL